MMSSSRRLLRLRFLRVLTRLPFHRRARPRCRPRCVRTGSVSTGPEEGAILSFDQGCPTVPSWPVDPGGTRQNLCSRTTLLSQTQQKQNTLASSLCVSLNVKRLPSGDRKRRSARGTSPSPSMHRGDNTSCPKDFRFDLGVKAHSSVLVPPLAPWTPLRTAKERLDLWASFTGITGARPHSDVQNQFRGIRHRSVHPEEGG